MAPDEQAMYDSILKGMSVAELKEAVISNLIDTNDLNKLYSFCLNAALTFKKKAELDIV
jgi:hypothetical protein